LRNARLGNSIPKTARSISLKVDPLMDDAIDAR
jgi:hypothetical protein